MHVHAGLRERRAKLGIPVLAVIDVGKAVAAVLNGVVRAKKSRFDMLGFRNIASPDEHMANGDVPQHLREQIIQIITRRNVVEEWFVFLLDGFQVKPVQARIVKKVPFVAPHLVVHVLPLGAWIDINLHRVEPERPALARLRRSFGGLLRRGNEPLVLLGVQHLLAIKRHVKAGHTIENLLRLARFHVELMDFCRRPAIVKVDGIDLRRLAQE